MSISNTNPTSLPTDATPFSFTTTLSLNPFTRQTHIFTNPFLANTHHTLYDPADKTRAREANVIARVEQACIKALGGEVTRDRDVHCWGWIDEVGAFGIEGVAYKELRGEEW